MASRGGRDGQGRGASGRGQGGVGRNGGGRHGNGNRHGSRNRRGYGGYGNYGGWPFFSGFYLGANYGGYGGFGGYGDNYYEAYPVYEQVPYDETPPVVSPQLVPGEQPAPVQPSADSNVSKLGLDYLRRAEDAFRAGNYQGAMQLTNHALVEMPRDGVTMLFLSQVLFAVENYPGAAAAAQRGMSLLDPKDWGYIVKNYTSYYEDDAYIKQMNKLLAFNKANPKAAFTRFLQGYHYGYLGHPEAAQRYLILAIKLEPRDKMARRLLEQFGGKPPAAVEKPPIPAPMAGIKQPTAGGT